MKKILIFASLLAFCTTANAQLDAQSNLTLLKQRNQLATLSRDTKTLKMAKAKDTQNTTRQVIGMARLEGEDAISELEAQGAKVLRVRGNIAVVSMPIDDAERLSRLRCVKSLQLARPLYQKMDKVRLATGADRIQSGTDLTTGYTGRGVVAGGVDNGFDPNHPNFLTQDGTTRFGYMSKIYLTSSSSSGYVYENYYPQSEIGTVVEADTYPIEQFKTDSKTNYHGTHTLGIMAGGYKGNVTNARIGEDGKTVTIGEEPNPYYGMAPDAELVASCGDLYDAFIMYGIEDIIAYAQYSIGADILGNPVKKKPCVINLSLGSNLGPHDKNAMMNQFLALAGQEAIICISAGNEGDYPVSLHKQFGSEDQTLQSFIKPIEEGEFKQGDETFHNLRYGSFYAYSGDDSEFEIQLVVYNQKRGNIAFRMPVSINTEGTWEVYASSTDYYSDAKINSTFQKAFNGYVALATAQDEDTGRYYAMVDYLTSDNQDTNADGNYILGLVITGKDGKKVDIYGDAQYTYFDGYGKEGWTYGTRDGTISDMAVADNVVVVGSYNTREYWPSLGGTAEKYAISLPENQITDFSSYGTLEDGTTLPHVCAPGACVVSSASSYFVDYSGNGVTEADLTAKNRTGNRNNYWIQAIGTSMATPVVAGGVALWLEANPKLKVADVIDIIQTTALKDEAVKQGVPAQWGAGKFDAYAGLKEVLRRMEDGIEEVNNEQLTVNSEQLFNLAGQRVNATAKGILIKDGKKYIAR